jgi:hypothetical protein
MKWPWVSREQYVLALATAAALESRLNDAEKRYDSLLEKFTALRVQGAVPEPKVVTTNIDRTFQQLREDDELRDLIHEKAGTDFRRRGMMLAQLKRDRADKVPEETIRERIEDGVQSEGVPL